MELNMKKLIATVFIAMSLVLSGCASIQGLGQKKEQVSVIGKVVAVRNFTENKEQPNGAGALIGAIGGGVLGHQVGQGDGKTWATVLGTIGGGVAGSQINKKTIQVPMQEVIVSMPNSQNIGINVEIKNGQYFQVGQVVKITTDGKKSEIKAI